MSDTLELRGLRLVMFCGLLPEERDRPQPIEFDIDMSTDTSRAGETDALADTIDYGEACDIVAALGSQRFDLLEAVAARAASALLAGTNASSVTVAVRKLRPPVPHDLATAGVRITRFA